MSANVRVTTPMATLDILANASLWAAVLRIATPLLFGTLGALLCERVGVLNLGIEGIMTFGAMIGWLPSTRVAAYGLGCWRPLLAEPFSACSTAC
jgi:general nucleoside transport system permease protein